MSVLSINLGPEGLKKDGIPSIDGVLTSLGLGLLHLQPNPKPLGHTTITPGGNPRLKEEQRPP